MEIGRTSLDAFGIVAGAIRAWLGGFWKVAAVSAIFTVPIFVLSAALVSALDETRQNPEAIDSEGTVLAGIVTILLSGLLTAILVLVFVRIFREEEFSAGRVLEQAADKLPAIVMFSIVTSLLIGVALILPIVGLVLVIIFSIGLPAMLVEDLRGLQTIRVSFRLFFRHWRLFLQVIAIGLVVNIALSAAVGGLTSPGAGPFTSPDFTDVDVAVTALQIVASTLIAPLIPALATALYFEAKGRDDGFPSI